MSFDREIGTVATSDDGVADAGSVSVVASLFRVLRRLPR